MVCGWRSAGRSPGRAGADCAWCRGPEELLVACIRRGPGESTVRELVWLADSRRLLVLRGPELWQFDLADDGERLLHYSGPDAYDLQLSPDGRFVSYLRGGDLWLFDWSERSERRLTFIGQPPLSVPATGRYSRPELEIGPGIWGGPTYAWSPSASHIAVHHVDRRQMRQVPFPNYLARETDPNLVRRGYPGDPNEARRVGLLRVRDRTLELLDLDDPQSHQIVDFSWSAQGDLLIDSATDTATVRRLYTVKAGSSAAKLLWESRRDTRIYTNFASRWNAEGDAVIALSDHEEFYGLYRIPFDGGGGAIRRLDDPAFDVLGAPQIATNGAMFFESTAGLPAERHVVRLSPGDDLPTRLTQTAGHHVAYPSPDGGAVAIVRSDDRTPPELYLLREGAGEPVRITWSPPPAFADFPLAQVRYLQTPAVPPSEGSPGRPSVHVRLMLPADFDPAKRYPVLFGPMYSNTVRNRWGSGYTLMQQALTQRGYLVAQVDVRGSTGYGRAFREGFLNDFAGHDIEDIVAAVAQLKSLPYVDGDRLGIWGSSYGGTLTVYTLLKKPGLFAAGVAAAAAVDPAFFGTDDVAIVGRPADASGIFGRRAELLVDRLEDPLLLVHGLQDQVVPFKTVASLTDAFLRAGKYVETAFLPGATHAWRREPPYDRHVFRRLLEFFDRHLKPAQPATAVPSSAATATPVRD